MLCPSCHTDAPAGAAFCPKCGQALDAAAASGGTAADKLRTASAAAQGPAEPEQELWHGRYTPKAMYSNWVLAVLVTIAAIVLAVLVPNPAAWIAAAVIVPVIWLSLLLLLLTRLLNDQYRLTSQRFLHTQGILGREVNQVLLVDIDDVAFKQSLMGRFLNFGTVTLLSNDVSEPSLTLMPIVDVERVANLIDHARREERRKRAIYMAQA